MKNKKVLPALLLLTLVSPLMAAKEHVFPLMGNLVKDRPNVPPPYGVAVIANWIDTEWDFESGAVGINDNNVPLEFAQNCDGNIGMRTAGVKADLWVLPFLNFFVVGGDVHADASLNLKGVPLKHIVLTGETVRGDVVVDFDLDGTYYTGGMVLAGGYKNFFGTVDMSATYTDFGKKGAVHGDQSNTFSAAPRIGYQTGLSQIWVGARYMDYSTHYQGTVPLPSGNDFTFDVRLKTASWNMSGGIRTVLKEHWEVLLETGFGERHMMTGSVGYRW